MRADRPCLVAADALKIAPTINVAASPIFVTRDIVESS